VEGLQESGYGMFASAARWVVRWWLSWFGRVDERPSRAAVVAVSVLAALAALAAGSLPVWADQTPPPAVTASPTAQREAAPVETGTPTPSPTAYTDLSAAAAADVFEQQFPAWAEDVPASGPPLAEGAKVLRYLDERSAVVEHPGGERSVVVSELPLRSNVGSGTQAPLDLGWEKDGQTFELANPLRSVEASASATGGAGLAEDGVMFAPAGADAAAQRQGSSLFYANIGRDTDYLLQPLAAGLEASFVLRSIESPQRLELAYQLGEGLSLKRPDKGMHSLDVVRDGRVIARVGAVHAFDADGAPVATSVSLVGSSLVIDVPHRDEQLRYPILVDPALTYAFDSGFLDDAWDWAGVGAGWNGWVSDNDLNINTNTATSGWAEWTYSAPGTGFIVSFSGLVDKTTSAGDPGQSSIGIRRAGGSWQTGKWYTPSTGPFNEPASNTAPYHQNQQHCVIASCAVPVATDAPTNNLSYFVGDQAVTRLALPSPPSGSNWSTLLLSDGTVELADPESPTLTAVAGGASGWVRGISYTATGTASDPGLGVTALEVMHGSTVVAHANRACMVASGACTGTWNGSAPYNPGTLSDGPATLGLRAVDALDRTSAVGGTWSVKVDATAPAVSIGGSGSNHVDLGTGLTVSSNDGSTAVERSGIKTVHVSIDGTPLPDVNVSCPSGVCPRTDERDVTLAPGAFAEGQHTVTVEVEDLAGNVGTDSIEVYLYGSGASRTKLGLEDYFSYESTPTGAGTAAHVNVANGNVVWQSTPIINAGRGLSTVVNLTYNAQDRGGYLSTLLADGTTPIIGTDLEALLGVAYAEAGPGFSVGIAGITRLNEPLAGVQGVGATNPPQIRLTDADGTLHIFTRENAHAGWYVSPAGVNLALRRNDTSTDKRWVATRPDGVRFYFDESGYQTYIVDRNGNTITFEYELYSQVTDAECFGVPDPDALCTPHVIGVLDPAGRKLEILYEEQHRFSDLGSDPPDGLIGPIAGGQRISQIIDHAGRELDFLYTDGYLTGIDQHAGNIRPGGTGRSFVFDYTGTDADKVLASVLDPNAGVTAFDYEAAGPAPRRATSATNRRNNATAFGYATGPERFTATRPGSVATTYQTDVAGRVTSITEDVQPSVQRVTGFQWDGDNNLTRYEVAQGTAAAAATTLTYDVHGNPRTITDPLSHTTELKYRYGTEAGPSTDGSGYVSDLESVRYPRDASPLLTPTVTFGLNALGNVTSRQYRGKPAATIAYPSPNLGLPQSETDEVGNTTTYSNYDDNGFPQIVVDPRQSAGETVDGMPYAGTWRYSYDVVGNLRAVTDPRGSVNTPGMPYTTSFDYDEFDQVVSSQTPKCTAAICSPKAWIDRSTSYDMNGNPIQSIDGRGAATARSFTAMDQIADETAPAVEHHGEGGPAGEVTAYDYDARDNLTLVTAPNGTATTSTAGDFATALAYDSLDRRVRMTRQSRGSETKDLITSYAYDLRDNVLGIADPQANQSGVPEANAVSAAKQRWAYVYDAADRLTDKTEDPDGLKLHTQATYDANDNIASVVSPRGLEVTTPAPNPAHFTTAYTYDIRDQVLTVTRGGTRTTAYTYYDDGKILSVTAPKGRHRRAGDRRRSRLRDRLHIRPQRWDQAAHAAPGGRRAALGLDRRLRPQRSRRSDHDHRPARERDREHLLRHRPPALDHTAELVDGRGRLRHGGA
jgi:YD repeat-containing protein